MRHGKKEDGMFSVSSMAGEFNKTFVESEELEEL
jgi:hypothetical protein